MAKTTRETEGLPLFGSEKRNNTLTNVYVSSDDVVERKKKAKWSKNVYRAGILTLVGIMVLSFIIPDEYYNLKTNIFFLNLEVAALVCMLLVERWKGACKIITLLLADVAAITLLNLVYLLTPLPFISYLLLSLVAISAVLSVVWVSRKG